MEAVQGICDASMRAFARLLEVDADLRAARERLGAEKFGEVACGALRTGLRRVLVAERMETLETVRVAGDWGARVLLAEVVAEARRAVLAAAADVG